MSVSGRLGYGDVVFVAHNSRFDLPMFSPYIRNLIGTVCTLKLARKCYPDMPNHKLQTLREMLSLDGGDAHSAMGDVLVAHALMRRIMDDFTLGFDELVAFHDEPAFVKTMPFGKHKGVPLQELPASYKLWLLSLPDLDENLRYSLQLVVLS